jgi:hypothetical protein
MLTQTEIVILALLTLGGEDQPVDTEDVAVRSSELVPGIFAWKKKEYADQINLELVRVALSDAGKKDWVIGSKAGAGWLLSPEGLRVARDLEVAQGNRQSTPARIRNDRQLDQLRQRIFGTQAWNSFQGGETFSRDQALEVFRISVYASDEQKRQKVASILNQLGEDKEVGPFLREAATRTASDE